MKRKMIRFGSLLFCFILFLISGTNAFGVEREIRFDHVFKMDSPSLLSVLQDQDGFLWFATQNGLVRYDGLNRIVYKSGPNSINNDLIMSLVEDKSGAIWIGTQGGGLNKYDKATNKFTYYRHDPKNSNSISSDTISINRQSLFFDHNGILWIGTPDSGLNRYDQKTGIFQHYVNDPKNPNSLSNNFVWAITEDHFGTLWIGTATGMDKFEPKTGTFKHYRNDPKIQNSIGKGWVYNILVDKTNPNLLWLGTVGGGLYSFDTSSETFQHFGRDSKKTANQDNDEILSLIQDDQGCLWIGWYRVPVSGGLTIFDTKTKTFKDYKKSTNPYSISGNQVYCVFEDRSNIIWVVNQSGSIDKYDKLSQKFKLYTHDENNPNSISDNSALSYYQDKSGTIWFGSFSGGLNKYVPEMDHFISYRNKPNDRSSIRNNFVSCVFEDDNHVFWVATRGGTLSIFNRKTGKCIKHYENDPKNPNSLPVHDSIRKIIVDKDDPNILWIAAYLGGFYKFDKTTEKFTAYKANTNNPNGLNSESLFDLYQDQDGIIWISTLGGGLNRFDKKTKKFVHYRNDVKNPKSIGSNMVYQVTDYKPGYLWVATAGGGLESFDKKNQTFTRSTKENGLPINGILSIKHDNDGNLWLGTDQGLIKFNPDTKETRIYKKSDGLQGDIFLDGASLFSNDGELWFGGVGGVNRFNPDKIVDNPYIPPVALTSLTQGGEPITVTSALTRVMDLKLDWKQNFFEFGFAVLNYTLPEKNQYMYKLEGFDKDWYHSGTQHNGRYSGLPPGNYTLMMKGSNNDQIWNDKGIAIKVQVVPPFWATKPFIAIIVLLILAAIFVGIYYRIRKINLQKEALEKSHVELERKVEYRTEELNALNEELNAVNEELIALNEELMNSNNGFQNEIEERLKIEKKLEIANENLTSKISELNAMQAYVIQTEKMSALGSLVAGMAHEINTPIGVGMTAASFLHDTTTNLLTKLKNGEVTKSKMIDYLDDLKEATDIIVKNIDKAGKLIQSFKLVSVDQSNNEVRVFKVKKYLEEILLSMSPHLKHVKQKLILDCPEDLEINDAPGAFAQIITNLVNNALMHAYTPEVEGIIRITAIKEKDMLVLTFNDDGVGIDPSILKNIYDPFFTTKRSKGGSGLGLYIVYNLITQQFNGTIECTSEKGKGTTFIIRLPMSKGV